MGKVVCITGIDTDIGKTVVTGLLAKYFKDRGYSVITQKLCQTGCSGISEDIHAHRKIMGVPLEEVDHLGITCPYVFKEPCSPHLAAQLENAAIDPDKITSATIELQKKYDIVVVEGVGGLMVPLTRDLTLIEYLRDFDYYHLLVSSTRLGSINHTLSSLELMCKRKLNVLGIIYNMFADSSEYIKKDSKEIFELYLRKFGFPAKIADMQSYNLGKEENMKQCVDFDAVFNDDLWVKK